MQQGGRKCVRIPEVPEPYQWPCYTFEKHSI